MNYSKNTFLGISLLLLVACGGAENLAPSPDAGVQIDLVDAGTEVDAGVPASEFSTEACQREASTEQLQSRSGTALEGELRVVFLEHEYGEVYSAGDTSLKIAVEGTEYDFQVPESGCLIVKGTKLQGEIDLFWILASQVRAYYQVEKSQVVVSTDLGAYQGPTVELSGQLDLSETVEHRFEGAWLVRVRASFLGMASSYRRAEGFMRENGGPFEIAIFQGRVAVEGREGYRVPIRSEAASEIVTTGFVPNTETRALIPVYVGVEDTSERAPDSLRELNLSMTHRVVRGTNVRFPASTYPGATRHALVLLQLPSGRQTILASVRELPSAAFSAELFVPEARPPFEQAKLNLEIQEEVEGQVVSIRRYLDVGASERRLPRVFAQPQVVAAGNSIRLQTEPGVPAVAVVAVLKPGQEVTLVAELPIDAQGRAELSIPKLKGKLSGEYRVSVNVYSYAEQIQHSLAQRHLGMMSYSKAEIDAELSH